MTSDGEAQVLELWGIRSTQSLPLLPGPLSIYWSNRTVWHLNWMYTNDIVNRMLFPQLRNPPKITHEPIIRIISKQLDIKLRPFTQEDLDSVLRKIKNRKAARLDEIPPEVWKTRQFDNILLRHCNAVYNQNPIDRWMKGCILPFPKKGDQNTSIL